MNVQQRKTPANERKKPRMLKDFLSESSDSCPSGAGFKSFPTQPCSSTTCSTHDQYHSNPNNTMKLLRSRSKAASAATISAVQALINAFKKYPPMFLSRKKYYSSSKEAGRSTSDIDGAKIRFRVKDIVRWSSFKDLVQEKSRPLDVASSPDDHHQQYYYYCTTTNTSNTTCSSSSDGSSWCESDFTSSEYLLSSSSWHGKSKECGEHEVKVGKKYLQSVGRDCLEVTAGTESYADMEVGPKIIESELEEKEQQSPVSVLDFQVGDNEESFSAFTRSLACVERTRQNLMQKIQRFESLAKPESFDLEEWMSMEENTEFRELHHDNKDDEDEEEEPNELEMKVRELVNHVKVDIGKAKVEQLVLLDFFLEQLSTKKSCQTKKDDDDDDELEREMVSMAKAWMRGEHNGLYEWGLDQHKREAYVREMDRREMWSKFEEEQQEVALEIETQVLEFLVDEVFVDLFLR
ncbi:uncharacterized protein LOC121245112 [Juglans microcarpa x Juglans regia]|uniref:uncharacterized protein LOC121245112 n=1 Tax=Juglans microcarpa x Juglans regia TaxID=2249226 RepID=UPI001B7F41E5|nr:uncharacterized protein LOC121245112 [Juglans microcarpa x Juglans regia]